jgi:hypothetical protein
VLKMTLSADHRRRAAIAGAGLAALKQIPILPLTDFQHQFTSRHAQREQMKSIGILLPGTADDPVFQARAKGTIGAVSAFLR